MNKYHPLVYAVITHWNNLEDTKECLNSLLTSDYPNLQALIVDNGSTNDSPNILAGMFPNVFQIRMGENGAITAAYNAGIEYALTHKADYILMLNNDISIDPKMIWNLIKVAEKDPSIGILTPKIYYYDRPEIIWFAGGKRGFDFGSYDTHEGKSDNNNNSTPKEVDYAWACGMLMRRSLLEKMGLFDTRFYLYYDDVDISLRAQNAGYKIWYVPEAKMWHKVSHSTGNARFAYIWARSKIRLYCKHTRGLYQFSLIIYAFIHGAFRAVFPRQDNMRMHTHPRAYIRGLYHGLSDESLLRKS